VTTAKTPPFPSTPLPTELFDYALPEALIAQRPSERRDDSRLLVVDRSTHTISHHRFAELPEFLHVGDTLFRNNAAVLPARLRARRVSTNNEQHTGAAALGGAIECFLLRPHEAEPQNASTWHCLLRPSKRLPVGATFADPKGEFTGEVLAKSDDGTALVRLSPRRANETVPELARRLGRVPLPPYIHREKTDAATSEDSQRAHDLDRYQTVYADESRPVAVAAPTAGLHFTPELLARLATRGVALADLTLHVGLGTFRPITKETVEAHQIHRECYEIPPQTLEQLRNTTGRRIAVGTTTLRSIEHYLKQEEAIRPTSASAEKKASPLGHFGEADLFVYPPAQFHGVDALLTNFHQPRSTLLCLVAAFLSPGSTEGIAWLHAIYAEAIARHYRFFSYGDAMLIL